ncbi:MAG: amidohydrolase family protein [Rhodoferax sp.]
MRLQAMRIPPCVRGAFTDLPADQTFDLWIEAGDVISIAPSTEPARGTLLSGFVDAHVHLDKAYTVGTAGAAEGDLMAAIARCAADRVSWTAADLRLRMLRALEDAWACGTRAMRTHLDWASDDMPVALRVFEQLREQWRGRIDLQMAALVSLDQWADPAAAQRIAGQVAVTAAGGTSALGAFVYRHAALREKLEALFDVAQRHYLPLDIHVDEGLAPDAQGLRTVAEIALARGWQGRILCSHACALSVQPRDEARATLQACRDAGIHLVSLPTTNLYLQGDWAGTPVERGITRLREAVEQGLAPCIATDNVADPFYPYGSFDLVETFGLAVQVAHLAPVQDWLAAITVSPARAMGLHWDGRIDEGSPADLVCLAARDDHELLTPAGRQRSVVRKGRFL